MVSQRWHDIDWKHTVWIVAPDSWIGGKVPEPAKDTVGSKPVLSDSALMLIAGGSWPAAWGETPPERIEVKGELRIMAAAAEASNSPALVVSQIPFQPMMGDKYEDALIAETFKRYLSGEGNDWPLLMPMVKAASRAMDVAQSVIESEWKHPVRRFTVTGASKRGWTTWLTSAVDTRVDALAPMVIDMLNMPIQMKHQLATWGKYSEEIADYTELDLPKYLATPPGKALQRIVDPYRYRKLVTQPKLLIFGTNDRYWPLDACNLYWNDLESSKYLLYCPNQSHGIADYPRLLGGLVALHRSRTGQGLLPKLEWMFEETPGKLTLTMDSDTEFSTSELWVAKSATRDFRDSEWIPVEMERVNSLESKYSIDTGDGFVAAFGDWTFDFVAGISTHLTTNVQIVSPEKK
jgi:PhoPQ-activated pathogenicity-related protein